MNDKIKIEFEEPYIEEDHVGYTTDFSEWVEFLKSTREEAAHLMINLIIDGEIVDFFRDASGYMLEPVAKRGSEVLLTKSRKFRSIDDLRDHLDLENIFVYQIIDTSGKRLKKEYESEAEDLLFSKKPIPEHMMTYVENDYIVRYAELSS